MIQPTRSILMLSALLMLIGCDGVQVGDDPQPTATPGRISAGYAGFYDVVSRNQGVDKVLAIKSVPPALKEQIKAIAATCREAADLLDDFADRDPTLEFDDRRLPEIEDETRQDIEGQTQQRLLFSSGQVFATHLILAQIKAMQYLHHLAATLSEEDEQADRSEALGEYAKRFAAHEKALLAMLKPVAE